MTQLNNLKNTTRPAKRSKTLGRGPGSKRGKTCGRGIKGEGARSGHKQRYGYQGGGVPLHQRTPTRGFSTARFRKRLDVINLGRIQELFEEGDTVSIDTLSKKGLIGTRSHGIKVLAKGRLSKKVKFDVVAFSKGASEKLKEAGITV